MAKPRLVKSSSAKAMHELANAYEISAQDVRLILKHIECRASAGSYWCWSPFGSFEWAQQLKQKLEDEGFKATIQDPDPSVDQEDLDYCLRITW